MAVNSCHCFLHSQFATLSSPSLASTRRLSSPSRNRITCTATPPPPSSSMEEGRRKLMEFPYVPAPVRDLMVDLISTVDNRLESQLHPCTLPLDVQYYENTTGNSQASLQIRRGQDSSPIDYILESWIHSKLPTGGDLNITSLLVNMNSSTDAPNFLTELIQPSPTSVIIILDLPPRKDPVLYPDYLHTFYESTQLDTYRQKLEKLPEVKPYLSPSLYVRSVFSPTVIMFSVETETGDSARMEEIVRSHLIPVFKDVLGIWLNQCTCGGREVGETEKAYLKKRDSLVRIKSIEIDLESSFPRLFGPELASRVVSEIRKVLSSGS
ncbi:hypothetical protein Dsin_009203 [Dipteronia sinensis]|uniref:Red chlorophyll catabolite reductase n=1 Tax=Dipteronia sinensis TaxID=43782 RepID=A0AAE0AQ63_9ROSI|nr:hypothetical protein Dsin_009203 [Dipteronia sinensis]